MGSTPTSRTKQPTKENHIMTFEEYVNSLNKFLKEHPETAKMRPIYAADDEGNDFGFVHYAPSMGTYDDGYQTLDEETIAAGMTIKDCNVVCIN